MASSVSGKDGPNFGGRGGGGGVARPAARAAALPCRAALGMWSRSTKLCAVIGYPYGKDSAILCARYYELCPAKKKNVFYPR